MRFERLELAELDGKARDLGEHVMAVSADGLGGPFNLMLRSPEAGQRLMEMLSYFNDKTKVLEPDCRRLVQLVLARRANAAYAWWTHARRAIRAGQFGQDVIDALNRGEMPESLSARQNAVVRFVAELSRSARVSDGTFEEMRRFADDVEIGELVILCGVYTTVAYLLNVSEAGIPAGEVDTLLPLSDPFSQL